MTRNGSALAAGSVALRRHGFWHGPDWAEAERVFELCLASGMTPARAFVLGHVASWEDCWSFARKIAERSGVCVRTFFRALAEAKAFGFMRTARAKKDEVPKGGGGPLSCGFSHRWIIGRGLAIDARKPEHGKARVRWLTHLAARASKPRELLTLAERTPRPRTPPRGVSTADWISAELAKVAPKPRDGPE